jgi:hypothetical protein
MTLNQLSGTQVRQGCLVTSGGTFPSGGNGSIVQVDVVEFDSGDNFDLNNNEFVVPLDGLYSVFGQVDGAGTVNAEINDGSASSSLDNSAKQVSDTAPVNVSLIGKYFQGETIALFTNISPSSARLGVAFLGELK